MEQDFSAVLNKSAQRETFSIQDLTCRLLFISPLNRMLKSVKHFHCIYVITTLNVLGRNNSMICNFTGNFIRFRRSQSRGVMGSHANCLLVSYCTGSLAKRLSLFALLLASHYHPVILNDVNCFCEGKKKKKQATLHHKMSTRCASRSASPTNPLITLQTNVCQKTTSQTRTLRIQ